MKKLICKNYLLIILLSVNSIAFAQIGAKVQQSKIYGIWQNSESGFQMTLILHDNGSGEFDGEEIKFTTQGNKLSITQDKETQTYTFALQGNSLQLSGGDLDAAMVFTRGGSTEQPATTNVNSAPIPAQQQTTTATSISTNDNNLIGIWSGNNETIEFKPNGQCLYVGGTFPYVVSQGHITLTAAQGNVMMAYKITGDQLMLTVNGQQFAYRRGTGNTGVTQNNVAGKTGSVAMDLVGKWCYVNVTTTNSGGSTSDECIILNGDGTYQYYSERSMSTNTNSFWAGTSSQNGDNGTWSLQGNRIYYNSVKSGQGSYQLQKMNHPKNNDPMIVLDGKTFVTFFQKAPW